MNTNKSRKVRTQLSNLILSETSVGVFGVVLMVVMLFATFSVTSSTTGMKIQPSLRPEAQSELPELVIPDDSVQTAFRSSLPTVNLPLSIR